MEKANLKMICPTCKFENNISMAGDACLSSYVCPKCNERIEARKGDCCVACSYAAPEVN